MDRNTRQKWKQDLEIGLGIMALNSGLRKKNQPDTPNEDSHVEENVKYQIASVL